MDTIIIVALVVLLIVGMAIAWGLSSAGRRKWWVEFLGIFKAGSEEEAKPEARATPIQEQERTKGSTQEARKEVNSVQKQTNTTDSHQKIK